MRYITPLVVGAMLFVIGCDQKGGSASMNDINDSASYAIGVNIAQAQLKPSLDPAKEQGIDINMELVSAAIRDVLTDTAGKGNMPDTIAQQILVRWQEGLLKKQNEENEAKGKEFLEANKTKQGVQTTASGLQYIVETEGSGDSPSATDSVVVNYKGMLLDSTVFDQSPPGAPATLFLGGLIDGWKEALNMMKPGAKWKLFIPANLAYGDKGGRIPPGSTLLFDIELVEVKAAK